MPNSRKKELFVFWHINKCGGTSFAMHMYRLFGHDYLITPNLNLFQKEEARKEGRPYWADLSVQDQAGAQIVMGHDASPQMVSRLQHMRDIKFMTILRSPEKRAISYFNHMYRDKPVPEADVRSVFTELATITSICCTFANHFKPTPQRFNTLSDAEQETITCDIISELERFSLVAFQEYYSEDMHPLLDHLKLPPIENNYLVAGVDHPRQLKESGMTRDICAEHLRHDFKIYNHFHSKRLENKAPLFDPQKVYDFDAGTANLTVQQS